MAGNHFTIEQANKNHIDMISKFQIKMALETEGMKLDKETVVQGVTKIFDDPDRGFYVIVYDDANHVIGSMLVLKEWSDWRNADVWWLHSVYIVPSCRGQGVFSLMFKHIEALGRHNRVKGLRLYVDKRNEHAQQVYQKIGMTNEHYEMYEKMFE